MTIYYITCEVKTYETYKIESDLNDASDIIEQFYEELDNGLDSFSSENTNFEVKEIIYKDGSEDEWQNIEIDEIEPLGD